MPHSWFSGCCVSVLVLASSLGSMPDAVASVAVSPTGTAVTPPHAAAAKARICYEQADQDADNGIVSMNWEPMFDMYDAQAVDDFVLSRPCHRPVISVEGSYLQAVSPADSFNVTIYRDKKHHPGKVLRDLHSLEYTDDCGDFGCADISLGRKLKPGHWWVSVQANMNYVESSGYWNWWTKESVRHTAARWQNPADGYGTGCTTYTDLITCVGDDLGMGGDLSFSISSS